MLSKDSSGNVNAPAIVSASVYILYFSLLIALGGGAAGLIFRLISVILVWDSLSWVFFIGVIRWIYFKSRPIITWLTIFALLCSLGLLFIGVTLQLPVFVNLSS